MAKSENPRLGTLRAAFEKTGSPHWIMYTIQQLQLDLQCGFQLQIDYIDDRMRGQRHSTEQALVDGEVDFIDSDWITLGRCRQQGLQVSAVYPYGTILGGLVVRSDSGINHLSELKGRKLGVVSQLDKNWILAQAYCQSQHQFDLAEQVELNQAHSKSVLKDWLQQGQVDAALVYWHQIPGLLMNKDYRLMLDITEVLPELGVTPTPTTFFIFRDAFIEQQPELVKAFTLAFELALERLRNEPLLWQSIAAELLQIDDPLLLVQIQKFWHSRMPGDWDRQAVESLQGLYAELEQQQQQRGQTLGAGSQLPDDCFHWPLMRSIRPHLTQQPSQLQQ